MVDTKFSGFASGGTSQSGDILVGLRAGVNTQFTGGYQVNNGYSVIDLSGGNVTLTNPSPAQISFNGQVNNTTSVTLPPMNASLSYKVGQLIQFYNASSTKNLIIKYNGGTTLLTLLPSTGVNIIVASNVTADGSFSYNVPLLASNNLADLSSLSTALTNLGLSPSSIPTFSSLLITSHTPVIQLYNNDTPSISLNEQIDFSQLNSSLSPISTASIIVQATNLVAGLEQSKLYINLPDGAGGTATPLLLTKDGLNDTQLNFTNGTKISNSQNALQLGINNNVQFARVSVQGDSSSSPVYCAIFDARTASTSAATSLRFFQKNSLGTGYQNVTLTATSTDVSSGNATGKLQVAVYQSGFIVSDAATITGDGLVDTQLNFTDPTKITNSQTALGLGTTDVVKFAAVYVQTGGQATLKLIDDQTASTLASSKIEMIQLNTSGTGFDSVIMQSTSSNVTTGTENSQLQVGVMQTGSFVSDALTLKGDGLHDTQINFSNSTKLSNSQTQLQIIGSQDICGINVWPDPTQGAQLTLTTLTNYSSLGYNFVQSGFSYLYISIPMPKRWDGSAVTFIAGCSTSATTGNYVLIAEAAIINFGATIDVGFGTPVSVTSSATAVANKLIKTTISSITPSGSFVAGDNNVLLIRIHRNGGVGSDTMTASALLSTWYVVYNSTAGNDA